MINKIMYWLGYIPKPKSISLLINEQKYEVEEITLSAQFQMGEFNNSEIKHLIIKNNIPKLVEYFTWNRYYNYSIKSKTGKEVLIEGKLAIIKNYKTYEKDFSK